jgi:hypothetical protein
LSVGVVVGVPLTMALSSSNIAFFLLHSLDHQLPLLLQSLNTSMLMLLSARLQHQTSSANFVD